MTVKEAGTVYPRNGDDQGAPKVATPRPGWGFWPGAEQPNNEETMKGWKTRAAAVLSIAYGLIGWYLDVHSFDTCTQLVIQGLAIAGIGHKLDRNTDAVNSL